MSAKTYRQAPPGFDKDRFINGEHTIPMGEQLRALARERAQAVAAFYQELRAGELPADLCHELTIAFNTTKTEYLFWQVPAPTPPPATPPDK